MTTYNRISDASVQKATGKTWKEWITLLDREGAKTMSHAEIARILWDKQYITKGWWCQMVTVGYEYAKGRRKVGQTLTAGYEIGIQKTIPVSAKKMWEYITNPAGLKVWLHTSKVTLKKGESYTASDGTTGEIRTVVPEKNLRLTWRPKDWKKPSTLQITIEEKGSKTSLHFHHEKLSGKKDREAMRTHWQTVSETLAKHLDA